MLARRVAAPRLATTTGGRHMGANAKRKTTMAKLERERRLIEKRAAKKARKEARRLEESEPAAESTDPFERFKAFEPLAGDRA